MTRPDYEGDEPTLRATSEADLLLPGGMAILSTQSGERESEGQCDDACSPSAVLLEGKFRLDTEIGTGGMGTVFRARDISLGRDVAVKFLNAQLQSDPASVELFRREARAMASVRHENVVQIHTFGQHGDTDFFIMEHIDGESLESMILTAKRRGKRIPIDEILRVLDGICAGLGAIHDAGLIHRDVKPSNLMVEEPSGRVVIMDFGLGRGRKAPDAPRRVKIIGGTPGYMAPETIIGRSLEGWEEVLADIYAFGVTAYELITGQMPFSAKNWAQLLHRHVSEEPVPLSSSRSDVSSGLDALVMKCLSREPMERFQWCDELRGAIQNEIGAHRSSPILSSTPPPASPRPRRGSRRTPSEEQSGPRVLVVSDDQECRNVAYEAACSALPEAHFRAARTPLSALAVASESPPLVIIASMHDEQFNGLEFAAAIRGEPNLQGVELILTARSLTDGDRFLLESMGITCVLPEPLSRGVLEGALKQLRPCAADGKELTRRGESESLW